MLTSFVPFAHANHCADEFSDLRLRVNEIAGLLGYDTRVENLIFDTLSSLGRSVALPGFLQENMSAIVDLTYWLCRFAEGYPACSKSLSQSMHDISLNLLFLCKEKCRELQWSDAADSIAAIAFEQAKHMAHYEYGQFPARSLLFAHLNYGLNGHDYAGPSVYCNIEAARNELVSRWQEQEDRLRQTQSNLDQARFMIDKAKRLLERGSTPYQMVIGNSIYRRRPLPPAFKELTPLANAILAFIGEIAVDDQPNASYRSQRALLLSSIFMAKVKTTIAKDKAARWLQLRSAANFRVLAHQAQAYADTAEPLFFWLMALVTHHPDEKPAGGCTSDVNELESTADASLKYAECLEAQILALPAWKRWTNEEKVLVFGSDEEEIVPVDLSEQARKADLPVIEQSLLKESSSAEEVRALCIEKMDEARRAAQTSDGTARRNPKTRLAGFLGTRKRRGKRSRNHKAATLRAGN
jgi:hypothetical protein